MAAAVALVSWFATVAEFVALARFSWSLFGIGPVVVRGRFTLPPITTVMEGKTTRSIGHSKLRLHDDNTVLSRPKLFPFSTPFPIKSTLTYTADGAQLEGRVPFFSTVFLAAWTTAWVVIFGFFFHLDHAARSLVSLVLGLGVVAVIAGASLYVETRRTREVIEMLKATDADHMP